MHGRGLVFPKEDGDFKVLSAFTHGVNFFVMMLDAWTSRFPVLLVHGAYFILYAYLLLYTYCLGILSTSHGYPKGPVCSRRRSPCGVSTAGDAAPIRRHVWVPECAGECIGISKSEAPCGETTR